MNRILLICNGSTPQVLSITPALSILKRNFPKALITVLTPEERADIFKNNPAVSEILHYKPFLTQLKQLKAGKFDLAILFYPSAKMSLLTMMAGIKKRIAPSSFLANVFVTNPVKINLPQGSALHQKHVELLSPLFIFKIPMAPKLYVNKKDNDWAQKYLQNIDILPNDKFICINPSSPMPHLNWPKENFAALVDRIGMQYPTFKVLLICHTKKEINTAQEIYWRAIRKPYILRESLSLANFISILNRAAIVISNYSAPSHIASALGKPALVFFPSVNNNKNILKPQAPHTVVLESSQERLDDNNPNSGLRDITVDQAMAAFNKFAQQIIKRSKKVLKEDDEPFFFGESI